MNDTKRTAAATQQQLRRRRSSRNHRELIGAIDQGTSSTRFLVFENGTGRLVASSQIEIQRIVPKEGWVEIDPNAIMASVYTTIENVHHQLANRRHQSSHRRTLRESLKCIGICNQRESTVVWDKVTGQALYNVIVWMDNRTKDLVDQMIDSTPGRDFNWLKDKTGLPMSTYFSAFKLKWLIDNVAEVKQALKEKRLLFGTVDSWILWNLTGKHLTDVTNASRTFLMDIETLEWDKSLCKHFNIPSSILPRILSSADDFGHVQHGPLKGLPITGVIGDQSAALFGHNCLQLGQTKATFGTGCFIMQNIGPGPLHGALRGAQRSAKRGLISTVAYKLKGKPASYALEGSIKIAGAALTWLRDNMQLIKNYDECDQLVNMTTNSAGVFFVPALGGLYAPYWDPNAAGIFIGLSQFSRREHLIRSTFDSIAFQTNDILSLMRGVTHGLMIDGGLCKSDNMCQILADITGCDIVRPAMCETSALGAAMVAGCGAGIWSYESMLANSNRPYEYSSSSKQNHHHYPYESLHYQDKFSSLIHSKSFPRNQSKQQQQTDSETHNNSDGGWRNSVNNMDADGGGINDDAGGGGVQGCGPPPPNTACADEDTDVSVQSSDNEEEEDVIISSGEFRDSDLSARVELTHVDLMDDNSDNKYEEITTTTTTTADIVDDTIKRHNRAPSYGYYSGDNFDKLTTTNSAPGSGCGEEARDSPIVPSQVHSGLRNSSPMSDLDLADVKPKSKEEHNNNKMEEEEARRRGSYMGQTFPSSLSTCLRNYVCPQQSTEFEDDDLYEDNEDDETTTGSSSDQEGSSPVEELPPADKIVRPTRVVDVFQSYISVEHRTELVGTWALAVERSMQWTKIQHEEIRKIDYQRLSSLPISMYLFFSIGMVALSGLMSAARP